MELKRLLGNIFLFSKPLSIVSVQTNLLQKIKRKPFYRYENIYSKDPKIQIVDWVICAFMFISEVKKMYIDYTKKVQQKFCHGLKFIRNRISNIELKVI